MLKDRLDGWQERPDSDARVVFDGFVVVAAAVVATINVVHTCRMSKLQNYFTFSFIYLVFSSFVVV